MSKKPTAKRPRSHRSKSAVFQRNMFIGLGLIMAVVFLPSTFLLSISMLPTYVAALVDKGKRRTKAVTVGAMNLAGTLPFLLELWMQGHNFDKAFSITMDASAIVVIYSAAAVGYVIDWVMTGVVSKFLLQRGKSRIKGIEKRQEELVERWGKEVTGDVAVDQYGFPLAKTKDSDR